MCGICGFNDEDKSLVKKMCDLIVYRGPDDWGYYTDSNVSIGVRRLSIIDLATGHQPQHNENEDVWIVYNGEIYNFIEIREILEESGHIFNTCSDTEVVIHAYEEWGEKCLNNFRGQFAFCIYDSKKQIFFLARDQMGLIPLYYYFDGDHFIFGSEIKCILCHEIERKINLSAFNLYLSLKYVPFNLTLFKGIYKLPPSSYLIFDLKSKSLKIKQYWNFKFEIDRTKTENILAKELRMLLEESVKIRLISEVPLGAFLSGGIDSSSVVALMSKFSEKPVKTFSIGFEKGAPVNETKFAKLVSEYYNTDHTELIVKSTSYTALPFLIWHLDDLIADAAIIPVYFMSKFAKEKITVALTGDGSDEIFAGYAEQYWLYKKNYLQFLHRALPDFILKYYNYIPSYKLQTILATLNSFLTEENRFFRPLLIVKDLEKSLMVPFKAQSVQLQLKKLIVENLDIINQYINYDLHHQLPNFYNMKTDKMSMAASLETRIPFLDRTIVKWASSIPSELKLRGTTEKYILRVAMKDLLPSLILKRKKLGFGTPVNLWLRTGMNEISAELFERLEKRRSLIKSKYIEKIKKGKSSKSYEMIAWSLLTFELWYETFIESDGLNVIKI